MTLFRAIYTSRPFGYDSAMLSGILIDARRANMRDGITGALICRDDVYLQWLEGPQDAVKAAIDRITHDDRHIEVTLHVSKHVSERLFEDWAMLHDPAATWIWSPDDIAKGAIDSTTADELEGFFLRLRDSTDSGRMQD
ncbi:BLUF domain-containing protein [Yoonia sp.]|uniref:BLUF domain-containing protein n=1 Tax=Yoonia sp. TaxID=2212373 RepID=UPI00391B64B7